MVDFVTERYLMLSMEPQTKASLLQQRMKWELIDAFRVLKVHGHVSHFSSHPV